MGNIQGCYVKGKLNECKDEESAATQIGTYAAVYDNSALLPVRDLVFPSFLSFLKRI